MRIMAFARKKLENPNLNQHQIEKNGLTFVRFLLLANPIKPNSWKIIQDLQFVNIQSVMVLKEYLFTTINVGYASGILNDEESVCVGNFDSRKSSVRWNFLSYENMLN